MLNRRSFLAGLMASICWKPESNIIVNGSIGIDPNPDAVFVPVFQMATNPTISLSEVQVRRFKHLNEQFRTHFVCDAEL